MSRSTISTGSAADFMPTARTLSAVHPSSILRAPDEAGRREATARFVDDLEKIAVFLGRHRAA